MGCTWQPALILIELTSALFHDCRWRGERCLARVENCDGCSCLHIWVSFRWVTYGNYGMKTFGQVDLEVRCRKIFVLTSVASQTWNHNYLHRPSPRCPWCWIWFIWCWLRVGSWVDEWLHVWGNLIQIIAFFPQCSHVVTTCCYWYDLTWIMNP